MYKSVSVPNPNGWTYSRFSGRKRHINGVEHHFRTFPDVEVVGPHYWGKNDGMKDYPEGPRQRWVKRRTISKRQARLLKAQMRVSVGL